MFMESLLYPCLSLKHHLKIPFSMNLPFRFFPLHRNHVDLVFLQKRVLISVRSPSIYCGFDLFLDDALLVFHLVHLCVRVEMKYHDVYRDFSNDFLIYVAFLPYASIFVTCWFVVNVNDVFCPYLVYYHDAHGNVTWTYVFLSVN